MIVGDAIVHEYIVYIDIYCIEEFIIFNSFSFSIPADHTTRANGRTDVDMVWAWNRLVDKFIAANGPRMAIRGVMASERAPCRRPSMRVPGTRDIKMVPVARPMRMAVRVYVTYT